MIAVVTDVYYKMALAVIRDLGEKGVKIVACQSEIIREKDKDKMPVGFYSKYVSETRWLPHVEKEPEAYAEALYKICKEVSDKAGEKCVIMPMGAKTLQVLASGKGREKLFEFGVHIPSQEQLDIYNGKKEVSDLAMQLEIPVPIEYKITDDNFKEMLQKIQIPCVVKPNCGEKLNLKAEQRYFIIKDRSQLEEKIMHFYGLEGEYPVVQEYVAGAGYGLSILAKDGEVVDFVGHRRVREYPHTGGPSTCCAYQEERELREYAKKMVAAVNYNGIAMFEYKQAQDGSFRLLEINPRVWGTYPLTRVAKTNFTYNWFALAYNKVNDKQIPLHQEDTRRKQIKMRYFFADVRAILNYAKNDKKAVAKEGLLDLFRPSMRDGVIEWSDFKASSHYVMSMFKK